MGNSAERTDHSTTIDHNVAMMLAQLINDGSPMVRKVRELGGIMLLSSALCLKQSVQCLVDCSMNLTHLGSTCFIVKPWNRGSCRGAPRA